MILQNFKRLLKMDYPKEFQALVEKMSFIINDNFDPVYKALAGRLSLSDNTLSAVRDVTFQVDGEGFPLSRTVFSLEGSKVQVVRQVIVGRFINTTNSTVYPTSGVDISWTQEVNMVVIDHVTGLQPGYEWTLTITAFG